MTDLQRGLWRIASVGLPGADLSRVEVPEADWPGFLHHVARLRITGLASVACREGTLVLTESQQDQLLERHRAAMAMVLLLEQLLREVAPALGEAGIPTVVLKG